MYAGVLYSGMRSGGVTDVGHATASLMWGSVTDVGHATTSLRWGSVTDVGHAAASLRWGSVTDVGHATASLWWGSVTDVGHATASLRRGTPCPHALLCLAYPALHLLTRGFYRFLHLRVCPLSVPCASVRAHDSAAPYMSRGSTSTRTSRNLSLEPNPSRLEENRVALRSMPGPIT